METIEAYASREAAITEDIAPLALGTRVGAYRVERVLGEGGMGRVYVAEHVHIGRRVALKMLRRDLAKNPNAVDRFFVEAQVVNRIRHPGIVEVTDLFVADGMPCIVMELLEGRTLALEIARGPVDPALVVEIATQIAEALTAAHAHQVIHRDLKPDNVVLLREQRDAPDRPQADRPRAKVLDFGVAKLNDHTQHGAGPNGAPHKQTAAGAIVGTPEYMAPEQLAGKGVDARTDVYALGVVLYECLTGVRPFSGQGFGDLVVQHLTVPPPAFSHLLCVPAPLETLVMQMLAKDARNRPQSMGAVVEQLRTVLKVDAPVIVKRRPPVQALFAGAAALVAAVTTIGVLAASAAAPPTLTDPTPSAVVADRLDQGATLAAAVLDASVERAHGQRVDVITPPAKTNAATTALTTASTTATTTTSAMSPAAGSKAVVKKAPTKRLSKRGVIDPFAGSPR